jgi:hypothetical protein
MESGQTYRGRSAARRGFTTEGEVITLILPQKFYKGRSQEKKRSPRLEFFLLRSPTDQVRSVPISRTMCSVAGRVRPAIGDSSISDFHRLSATKPVSSETSKAERRSR